MLDNKTYNVYCQNCDWTDLHLSDLQATSKEHYGCPDCGCEIERQRVIEPEE